MAARDGMGNLITRLRGMTETTASDYTLGSETYWSDDQLQDLLDTYRTDFERVALRSVTEYVDGDSLYYDYYTPVGTGNFEEVDTGVVAWAIRDSDGAVVSTDEYAVNYVNGHIRFTSDQDGETYYLRARMFDLNRAAADVWRQKAAHVAKRYDIKTDNHTLTRSQMRQACLEMADYYTRQAGGVHTQFVRRDLA
jgi:hypothetical protein